MRRLQQDCEAATIHESFQTHRPYVPGLHHAGRPVAPSGWVSPMNRTMTMMKKAGKRAVRVRMRESSLPHRCMKMAAIISSLGTATTESTIRVVSRDRSLPTAPTSIAVRTIRPKKFIQYASFPKIVFDI